MPNGKQNATLPPPPPRHVFVFFCYLRILHITFSLCALHICFSTGCLVVCLAECLSCRSSTCLPNLRQRFNACWCCKRTASGPCANSPSRWRTRGPRSAAWQLRSRIDSARYRMSPPSLPGLCRCAMQTLKTEQDSGRGARKKQTRYLTIISETQTGGRVYAKIKKKH